VGSHPFRFLGGHDFGDHGEPGGFPGLLQKGDPLASEPLESVGVRPGFEGPAAEHPGSRLPNGQGRFQKLVSAFDGAGTGHDNGITLSENHAGGDFHRPGPGTHCTACEGVAAGNGIHFPDSGKGADA